MKNTNKFMMFLSVIAACTTFATYADDINGIFELVNKTDKTIGMKILMGEKIVKEAMIKPGESTTYPELLAMQRFMICIYRDPTTMARNTNDVFTIMPGNNKTIYLTWNSDKYPKEPLYPQTGPLMGFGKHIGLDTTSRGRLLESNITSSQIKYRR